MSYSTDEEATRPWCPPVDVYRAEGHYVVKADLPGLNQSDIQVKAKGNTLAISGCRSFEPGEEAEEHLRLERLHGRFICELHLPGINSESDLMVGYREGVLQIDVPIS